jgi:hypothetical protein
MPIKAAWFVPAHLIRATTFSTGQHILRLENAGPENAAMHMVKNCLTPSLVGARPAATSGNAAGRQRPEAFNSGHTQRARALSQAGVGAGLAWWRRRTFGKTAIPRLSHTRRPTRTGQAASDAATAAADDAQQNGRRQASGTPALTEAKTRPDAHTVHTCGGGGCIKAAAQPH